MPRGAYKKTNSTDREVLKLEAAMAERPPRIVWRLDPVRRVQVAWSVDDPHADTASEAQARRARGRAERAERERAALQAERQRLQALQLMQDQADEVAERFRKHRADNTPLMTAARNEI